MHRFTYILVALVLVTLCLSIVRRAQPFATAYLPVQTNAKSDKFQEAKRHFPTAAYDEPDLTDAKKEKQKRYNNFKLVSIKPEPWKVETLITSDSLFAFPALPVAQSDLIFVGTVISATAHLSENKKNVFSEFSVAVESVQKATNQSVTPGSVLTIDRLGGHVRYPSGQEVLYRFYGANMPKTSVRYLFFINSRNKHDYNILTGYELTGGIVAPLDMSSQFAIFEGTTEEDLMNKLRSQILNLSN